MTDMRFSRHEHLDAIAAAALSDALPQQVITPAGENGHSGQLYAASQVGSTTVYFARRGQNQGTRDSTQSMASGTAYEGPQPFINKPPQF